MGKRMGSQRHEHRRMGRCISTSAWVSAWARAWTCARAHACAPCLCAGAPGSTDRGRGPHAPQAALPRGTSPYPGWPATRGMGPPGSPRPPPLSALGVSASRTGRGTVQVSERRGGIFTRVSERRGGWFAQGRCHRRFHGRFSSPFASGTQEALRCRPRTLPPPHPPGAFPPSPCAARRLRAPRRPS